MRLRALLVALAIVLAILVIVVVFPFARQPEKARQRFLDLPLSKMLLLPVPWHQRPTNSFSTGDVLSPECRYLAILNNGSGTEESDSQQSIVTLRFGTGPGAPAFPRMDIVHADQADAAELNCILWGTGKRIFLSPNRRTSFSGNRPRRLSRVR